jgi:hypothetical protein
MSTIPSSRPTSEKAGPQQPAQRLLAGCSLLLLVLGSAAAQAIPLSGVGSLGTNPSSGTGGPRRPAHVVASPTAFAPRSTGGSGRPVPAAATTYVAEIQR